MNGAPFNLFGKPKAAAVEAPHEEPKTPPREPTTPAQVVARWRVEGPLVHEPTGIASLDKWTGGGPPYGSRGVLVGAPDASKTLLLLQIADTYASRGILVGFHAVDEEDGDLVTRLMQRQHFHRFECEARTDESLELMEGRAADMTGWLFYDSEWTIEAAAADLADRAHRANKQAAYFADSIQTVNSDPTREDGEPTERAKVTNNMRALRRVAMTHRLIAIATAEMNRSNYAKLKAAEENDDMAAGAESRSIEFQARYMLTLRSVAGQPDLVSVKFAKNKLGQNRVEFWLAIDRTRQTLTEGEAPVATATNARELQGRVEDAASVAVLLASHPGLGTRDLYAELAAKHGKFSKDRAGTALRRLGAAVVVQDGPNRAKYHYLDGSRLDEDVLKAVPNASKPTVTRSSVPGVPGVPPSVPEHVAGGVPDPLRGTEQHTTHTPHGHDAETGTPDVRVADQTEGRAASREATVRARNADDDEAARALMAKKPDAPHGEILATLKGELACGTARARDAILRVRTTTAGAETTESADG